MAVAKVATRARFIGLSTDTKPTGVPIGSTFIETDTRDDYVTYDGTNWTKGARNSEADRVSEWLKNNNL